MKRKTALSIFFSLSMILSVNGQAVHYQDKEIHGAVIDSANNSPLPYASIYIPHHNKGVISNENGDFSIDVSGMTMTDTVCFHYIGYKQLCIPLGRLDTSATIRLPEEIYDLNETLIFGNAPDARWIVRQVVKNKEANYRAATCMAQAFIRHRDITDFDSFKLIYKGSTIPELDEEALKLFEEKIPKHVTSYTDFLGNLYMSENAEDSASLKVDPVRMVELKEKEIDELKQFETVFENLLSGTGEDEYWKLKTGIFSQKIDTPEEDTVEVKDTVDDHKRELHYYSRGIRGQLRYALLEDKDQWEFLHETGRYDYSLAGGTSLKGEDVYIINFEPGGSGLFTGRLYISAETYALIRADYEYAPGATGRDIHLLGIGYTETGFSGSIYFDKMGDNYILKYFSRKTAVQATVERNVEISKKRKRALFDKEVMDFDLGIDLSLFTENSVEYFALDYKEIPESQFGDFTQPESMEVIYVDQFDDSLWSGYSIIEPTKQMKAYKKQTGDY